MTPAMFGPVPPPVIDPAWRARLNGRLAAIQQLIRGLRAQLEFPADARTGINDICEGLEFILGKAEIEEQLRRIQNPPRPPKPTLEDFEEAQRRVEGFQKQLEALDKMLHSMPAETAEYFDTTQRPLIAEGLKQAEHFRARVQQMMEAPESPDTGLVNSLCDGQLWRVLSTEPGLLFVLRRPAGPDRPQHTELAERDKSLLAFRTAAEASTVAHRMNEEQGLPSVSLGLQAWEVGTVMLQSVERVNP